MSLRPGQMLSHYRLVEVIGEGGMGVIWKATDTTLDRQVAIKVLPEAFAHDAERLERFEREAKAVAALAHPNILSLYQFTREGDTVFAVTELLEGETLGHRLEAGPLPPRKVAEIAHQVASGLGAAHDQGIAHRDLKPENLFITHDGRVKILDFGLARTYDETPDPLSSRAETRTSLTGPGVTLGTSYYMSPEQVRGSSLDHRTDIFSLGTVIFEMLTGSRPFHRPTPAETMAAILHEDPPPFPHTVAGIPAALERVVRRCLEKSADERFQSARDLAFAIENAVGSSDSYPGGSQAAPRPTAGRAKPMSGPRLAAILLMGAMAGVILGVGGSRLLSTAPATATPVRVRTLTFSGDDSTPSASPDGALIAFASKRDGRPRIWIKQLQGGGEQPLTDGVDALPHFSPDGSSVLFLRDEGNVQSAYRQALVGGQPRKLVEDVLDASWSPDGRRLAFIRGRIRDGVRTGHIGIANLDDGTEAEIYSSRNQVFGLAWPAGDTISAMETSVTGNTPDYSLILLDLAQMKSSSVLLGVLTSPPIWEQDSQSILFARSGSVVGDQGDTSSYFVRRNLATGQEHLLFSTEYIFPNIGNRSAGMRMDIVRQGTLVFDAAPVEENLYQVSLEEDATGKRTLTRGHARDRQPVYSPDGKRVLFSSNRAGNLDLWILDLASGRLNQVTDDPAEDWDPAFMPDGEQIVWSSDRSGHLEIWKARIDGSSAIQISHDGTDAENPVATPDGSWILYWSSHPEKLGIWRISPDGSQATHLFQGPYSQPEISTDGRWLSFLSLEPESLRNVIYFASMETGEMLPFIIPVPVPINRSENVVLGRHRWLTHNRLAFVGIDDQGLTGIYSQDFSPSGDTLLSRKKIAGFSRDYTTESFGITRDGERMTLAGLRVSYRLMLAEDVPGVRRRR